MSTGNYNIQKVALTYLVALVVAESVTVFVEARLGLVLHGGLLLALIVHASRAQPDSLHKLLLTLILAPLTRILSLTVPLPRLPLVYWYALVGAPLLLAAFITGHSTHFTGLHIGLKARALPVQLFVGLTGFGLGYLEYQILRPVPLISALTWQDIVLPALVLLIFTGYLEEYIFRGLMQRASVD